MDEAVKAKSAAVCHRCLQPVPDTASRCPHCGVPIRKAANVRILLATLGLVLFLVLAFTAYKLVQGGGTGSSAQDQQQGQDGPPPPEKKPALGQ